MAITDGREQHGGNEPRVLVVDDAPEFVEMLVPLFEREGYRTESASDGESAVARVRSFSPDLIVLDLALPKLDGVDVCRAVRSFSDAYVLMLTARGDEADRVAGLEVGADDYMTKPFSSRELAARVRALLRRPRVGLLPRHHDTGGSPRRLGSLVVDPLRRVVTVEGDEVPLTRIEFDLLDALASEPTVVFSRSLLREQVWGPEWFGNDHVVDVHIANLRKKIDRGGASYVRTVRGVGYGMAIG